MLVHISTPYEETFIRRNAVLKFLQRFFFYLRMIFSILRSAQVHRASLRPAYPGSLTACTCGYFSTSFSHQKRLSPRVLSDARHLRRRKGLYVSKWTMTAQFCTLLWSLAIAWFAVRTGCGETKTGTRKAPWFVGKNGKEWRTWEWGRRVASN